MSETEKYHLYCDASFCNKKQLGIIGFILFDKNNCNQNISSNMVFLKTISEKNNIRSELKGVIWALEMITLKKNKNIPKLTLYTDCKSISNLLKRKERLISCNYKSKKQNCELSNADLYRKFFSLYDELTPEIIWVKGHSSKKEQSLIQQNFSYIDKLVRQKLRQLSR